MKRHWAGVALLVGVLVVLAWSVGSGGRARGPAVLAAGGGDSSHEDESARAGDDETPCAHPYLPTRTGTVLEYAWGGPAGAGTARLALLRWRGEPGAAVATWSYELDGLHEIERRCDDLGAEEPWLALLAGAGVELRDQSWRLPRELEPGVRYAGTVDTSIAGLTVALARAHEVVGHEELRIGETRYEALRVAIEDRTEAASAPIPSTMWIAEGVGMVRLELGPADQRSTLELVSMRAPR